MATADFLEQKRNEITVRLNELRPFVDEYWRLEAAAAALDGVARSSDSAAPKRSATPVHAPTTKPARKRGASGRGRGRPKGSGKRGQEALALVTANPGITIAELATQMGIKNNYVYRLLPGLARDGLVVKDGHGWRPRTAAAQPAPAPGA